MTHTEDLIARLRDTASRGVSSWGDLQQEAADELETLMNAVAAEPVAWGVFEGNLHDMYFTEEDAQELARLKGTHAEVRPLYAAPPQPVTQMSTHTKLMARQSFTYLTGCTRLKKLRSCLLT